VGETDDAVVGRGNVGDLFDSGEDGAQRHLLTQAAESEDVRHESGLAHVAEPVRLD
jgi:hypothetical protein